MAKWQLSKELSTALDQARSQLDDELADLKDEHSNMSERWRESEAGENVQAWIETLDLVAEALETANRTPQG